MFIKILSGDTGDNKCKACITSCKNCSGGSESDCLSCETPKFLYNKTCVETCPPKFWGEKSDQTCKKCQLPCENCISNSTICTSCTQNYFLHSESCLIECPSGYWGMSKFLINIYLN